MPEKPTPGSITQTADVQKDRINNISNVSRAINEMQKDVDQKISETNKQVQRKEEVQAVQNVMTQSVSKLNQTIGALATGVTRITADTAKATAGAINQYGKAISEDISFNKKSVVAMALAKTSPIYGYFVSKFMETNVWKQALSKMKTSIMQTMGAILRPFKGGAARGGTVPHAQTGGYIGQGGLAKVHAGETITPSGGGGLGDVSELIVIQRQQLDYMQRTFGLEKKYYKSWFARLSPMRVIRAFRRTKGNYTAQLSTSERPMVNMAHNIATLYTQLMWRLDNMMEIQKANAIANRDLTTFFTGIKYPSIPGIRLRELVKPFIRKLVGGIIKNAPLITAVTMAALGAPGTAIAGVVGLGAAKRIMGKRVKEGRATGAERFLTKERGVYAGVREPGFRERMGTKFRGMFPTREMLEQPGGGLAGTTAGGRGLLTFGGDQKRSLVQKGAAFAIGIQMTLGGRKGLRRPIWTSSLSDKKALQYYVFSKVQDKKQTKQLKQIRDSNEDQYDLQKRAYKRAGKWRLMSILKGAMSFIGNIISGVTGFGSKLLSGILPKNLFSMSGFFGKLFTSPLFWTATGIGVLAFGARTLWDWLNKKFPTADTLIGSFMKALRESPFGRSYDFGKVLFDEIGAGIRRIIEGQDLNLASILSKVLQAALDKFGVKDIIDIIRVFREGDREKAVKLARKAEETMYGKNVELIRQRQKAVKDAKGFTAKNKARLNLLVDSVKSHLGLLDPQDIGPEETTGLFGPKRPGTITDARPGKINQGILTKQDAIKQQADMIKDPIVEATNEVNQTIKDETNKSTIGIQNTTIQTSNQLNNSINDTTSISGSGRQREGMGADGWYQRAIFSGGR